jgi:hypothetical protein
MKLDEAFTEINRIHCFGYSPVSGSTKPAHIANGWFRRLLGKVYDAELLNRTVIHRTKGTEVNPSDALLTEFPEIFGPFRSESKRREFTDLRADLKALVSPYGGAVNKGNTRSSYNVTCSEFLTRDFAENSVGAFLYHLVETDFGDGPCGIGDLVRTILQDRGDEISTVCFPLVSGCQAYEVPEGSYAASNVFKRKNRQFASATLRNLRQGFEHLDVFEREHGGGLDALRRIVAFGVFSVLLHMANRYGEINGRKDPIPQLLYFQGRHRTTVYQASHYTHSLVRQQIESLYTQQLRQQIVDRIGNRPTVKKCERLVEDVSFKAEAKIRKQLQRTFGAYQDQREPVDALAEALRDVLFRNLKGTPVDFFRGIGVRVGFLRPAGNRAIRKYYTLEGVLMEAVLASLLPEGRIAFRELLNRLYDRYGLLTGGRPEDSRILLSAGIGQATVEDLRANANALRQQLVALGWGRQYADSVMYVQAPEGIQ